MRPTLGTLLCLPALCLPLAAQDASPAETEALVKEAIAFAKANGKGWHDDQYVNPTTQKRQPKTSYIEVWDNLIFGSGIYKK